jgi:hypothetical protein
MKYATVEDVIASFPHPILPTVQGEPDYQTIHAIWKSLQANSREIDTHLGGGTLGHLGLIVSDASYAMIALATDAGPTIWVSPTAPPGGIQPTLTEQLLRLAQHDTSGRRTFKLTAHTLPCSKHLKSKSSMFLNQCNWTF